MSADATDRTLAALASSRRRLLAELEGVDGDSFTRVPPGGGWSAAQIVEHLERVEGSIVRGARSAAEKGNAIRPGLLDPLRKLPLQLGLAELVRVRTPDRADPAGAPGEALSREQRLRRLEQVRADTVDFLEATRNRDFSRIYLRHPFFGAFAVRDMLSWVAWHEERHRRQVTRLRRSLGMR